MRHGLVSFTVLLASLLGLFLVGDAITSPPGQDNPTTTYKRSSSAITITRDGQTLIAANPDSNSISIVGLSDLAVKEIPVGVDPRTAAVDDVGDKAYVANRGSDSISVIDLNMRQLLEEIPVGSRPYVSFALLNHWINTRMSQSPEAVGQLLD
jgi:YVTN family beta-propeller protein